MTNMPQKPRDKTQRKITPPTQPGLTHPDKPFEKHSTRQNALLVCLLIGVCVTVLVTHWPALSARALSFDDQAYLTENLLVQNPGFNSTRRFLTEVLEPSTVAGYYQPLAMISLMFDYALAGRVDNLTPFHRTSLLLHIANTALIIILLYLLFGNALAAAAVGLLFGLHPMTVEPIPWIGERKTLLAAFFAMWSLIIYVCYTRRKNSRLLIACFITYLLALMSKPTSIPLPALMLLMDFWPLKRSMRRALIEKIPFVCLAVVSAIITYISQSRTAAVTLPGHYGPERIPLILSHNIIFYLYKIVWPVNLSSHYAFPKPFGLSAPMVLAGVIGTCILIPLLLVSLRWTRAVLTGWLFFFLAILPTMQIIGFSNVIASDKFAYLPSIGLLMILAFFLTRLASAGKSRPATMVRYFAIAVVVLALAAAEAVATRRYLVHWRDSISLNEHMLRITPDAAPLHNNLALTLAAQNRFEEAIEHYRKVLEIEPKHVAAHNNLGVALESLGKVDQAWNHYQQALQFDQNDAPSHYNIANILSAQGKLDEAINHYRQALAAKPYKAQAHNNLGYALESQGKLNQAIDHYRFAVEFKSNFTEAHYNLGNALRSKGNLQEATYHLRQALRLEPQDPQTHYNLGLTLGLQGQYEQAISHFHQAISIKPDYPQAHNNLAVALQTQGEFDLVLEHYRQALQLDPNYADAHYNLAAALASQGKLDEAIIHYGKALKTKPDDAQAHFNLGRALQTQGKIDQAVTHFQKAIDSSPNYLAALNSLAQILAAHSTADVRDPNQAIILAERAAQLTNHQNPVVLDTLATAYASASQFDKAVTTAETALDWALLSQNTNLANNIRKRLKLYKNAKPYRHTAPTQK